MPCHNSRSKRRKERWALGAFKESRTNPDLRLTGYHRPRSPIIKGLELEATPACQNTSVGREGGHEDNSMDVGVGVANHIPQTTTVYMAPQRLRVVQG